MAQVGRELIFFSHLSRTTNLDLVSTGLRAWMNQNQPVYTETACICGTAVPQFTCIHCLAIELCHCQLHWVLSGPYQGPRLRFAGKGVCCSCYTRLALNYTAEQRLNVISQYLDTGTAAHRRQLRRNVTGSQTTEAEIGGISVTYPSMSGYGSQVDEYYGRPGYFITGDRPCAGCNNQPGAVCNCGQERD